MKFVGTDPDDWTLAVWALSRDTVMSSSVKTWDKTHILLVQLSDLEDILAPTHDIVIKFIPRWHLRLAIGTQTYVEK